jgi:uncharacterized protein DUF6345
MPPPRRVVKKEPPGTIGIEWIQQYHGRATNLAATGDQAEGFYWQLDAVRQFDYSDDDAWDTDFEQNRTGRPRAGQDTQYADAVNMVYFSGHGHWSGAFFGDATHDNGQAAPSEIRLGDRLLDWIVFDACEVLMDDPTGQPKGAIERWQNSFVGMRAMLGFHSISSDESYRGGILADEMNNGAPVIGAWRRACEETEDSDIYFAFMYAVAATGDTFADQWYRHGTRVPKPKSPTSFVFVTNSC